MNKSMAYAEGKLIEELKNLERQLEQSLNKIEMYEDMKHNEGLNHDRIQARIKVMKLAIAKLAEGDE